MLSHLSCPTNPRGLFRASAHYAQLSRARPMAAWGSSKPSIVIQRAALATQVTGSRASPNKKNPVIGIRREDKNRWERRVALPPPYVKRLIEETGARVLVQPSNTRIFNNASFERAGAEIEEDLSKADIILGIKEVPIEKLIEGKTYVVFSHTHKGQEYNLPSLQAFLDKGIRLIDYELLTDQDTGKRLVLFGKHAGYAGMIDGLHGLGQRLLALGYNSPFIHMGLAHVYPNLECVYTKLRHVGNIISDQGLPEAFTPMVFTFTGSGNVAQGARAIFDKLPHKNITTDELPFLVKDRLSDRYQNKILALQVKAEDYVERIGGGNYDRAEYREHPERYRSVFAQKIAPYTTMLINGIYWESKYPRLLTTKELAAIQRKREYRSRMLSIADITCDIGGSLEFMSHATSIDSPFFYTDAVNGIEHKDIERPGVQINSIDNLPTELPFEASQHFGDSFYPFAKDLAMGNLSAPVLDNAVICENGELRFRHLHLKGLLERSSGIRVGSDRKKRVLLAGSGMVSGPLVDSLSRAKDTEITIASNNLNEAKQLARQFPNTNAALLNIEDTKSLDDLVKEADVAVSLVPAPLHPQIADSAIRQGKHMVTASYISPEMQALDTRARDSSVTLLNEIGLDPGIDHCSAMKIIDDVHKGGGKIKSFISWCGGLTAPENSGNALGYKFSWSPRGVLTAGLNPALFMANGKTHSIQTGNLFDKRFDDVPIFPGFAFEGLANRDSLKYADIYGLNLGEMDTMFRGTLRFKGYSEVMGAMKKLGFLDLNASSKVSSGTRGSFFKNILGGADSMTRGQAAVLLSKRLSLAPESHLVKKLLTLFDQLGVFTESLSSKPLAAPTALDAFSQVLQSSLSFMPEERDMVCLHHEFGIVRDDSEYEVRTSSLVVYGSPNGGDTAMARTVGIPAAIATRLLLEKKINTRGVIRPTIPEVYTPLLERLEENGIVFSEHSKLGIHSSLQRSMKWN